MMSKKKRVALNRKLYPQVVTLKQSAKTSHHRGIWAKQDGTWTPMKVVTMSLSVASPSPPKLLNHRGISFQLAHRMRSLISDPKLIVKITPVCNATNNLLLKSLGL